MIRDAGYDGEYGTIRLFRPDELGGTSALFAVADLRACGGEKENFCRTDRGVPPRPAARAEPG